MITTGAALSASVLRLLQIIRPNQTPSAADVNTVFDRLNEFIDWLRTQQAAQPSVQRKNYPLVSGTQQYTIGVGGAFNQAWPETINGVSIIPDRTQTPTTEIAIGRPLTWNEFQLVTQKGLTGPYPSQTFFDGAYASGLGLIWVYPVPTISIADIVLYTPNPLGYFADLSTQYDLKPGYAQMLRYNLAMDVADDFERPVTATIMRKASSTLADVKRANQQFELGKVDPRMPGLQVNRQYNPWTGSY